MSKPISINHANTSNSNHQSDKAQKKLFKEIYPAVFTQPLTVLIQHNHPIQFCLKALFDALKVEVAYLNGSTVQKILNQKNKEGFFLHDIDFEIKKTGLTETISKQTADHAMQIVQQFLLQNQTSTYGFKLQPHQKPWLQLKRITPEKNIISIGSLKGGTHIDLYCSPEDKPIYDTADASEAIKFDLTNKKAELHQPFSKNIINLLNQNKLLWFSEDINFGLMRLSKKIRQYIVKNENNFYLIQKNIPVHFFNNADKEDIIHIIERALKGEYHIQKNTIQDNNILWLFIFETIGLIETNRQINQPPSIEVQITDTLNTLRNIVNEKNKKLDFNSPKDLEIAIEKCKAYYAAIKDFQKKINDIVEGSFSEIKELLKINIESIMNIQYADTKSLVKNLINEPNLFFINKSELKHFFKMILDDKIKRHLNHEHENNNSEALAHIDDCIMLVDYMDGCEASAIKLQIKRLSPNQFTSPSPVLIQNIEKVIKKLIQNNKLAPAMEIISSAMHLIPSKQYIDFLTQELVHGKLKEQDILIKNKDCELFSSTINLMRAIKGYIQTIGILYRNSHSKLNFNYKLILLAHQVSCDAFDTAKSLYHNELIKNISGTNKKLIDLNKNKELTISDPNNEVIFDNNNTLILKNCNLKFMTNEKRSYFEYSIYGTSKIITLPDGLVIKQNSNIHNEKFEIQIQCLDNSATHYKIFPLTNFIHGFIKNLFVKSDILRISSIILSSNDCSFKLNENNELDFIMQFFNSTKSYQVIYDFGASQDDSGQVYCTYNITNEKVTSLQFEINDHYQTSITIPFDTSDNCAHDKNHLPEFNSTPEFSCIEINSKLMNHIYLDQEIKFQLSWNQNKTIIPNSNFNNLSNAIHGYGVIESKKNIPNANTIPFKWEGVCNIFGASGKGKLTTNHQTIEFENSFLSNTLLVTIADLLTNSRNPDFSFKPIVLSNSKILELGESGFLDQYKIDDNHFFTGYLYPDGSMIGLLEYRSTDENHLNSSLKGNFLLADNLPSETVNGFLQQFNNSYEFKKLGNLFFFPHGKICQTVEIPINQKTLNSNNTRLTEYLLSEKIYFFGHSFLRPTGENNNRYLRPVLTEYFHPNGDFYYSFINNKITYNFYFTKTNIHSSSIELIGKSSNGKSFDKTKFIILSSGKEEILVTENPSNLNKTQAIQL